ncbi:NUDIX hydrolase [Patescibacteria group bacterium]|nr:NUDIX hydrolase [Patescibacteria group bacterium]
MSKDTNPIPKEIRFAALAVDVVCFRINEGRLEMLVGEIISDNNKYKGQLAHIGGLIKVDETAEQSVDRLLKDKAGLTNVYKEQLYTFSKVDRDPRGRVVSVAYLGFTNKNTSQLENTEVRTEWKSAHDSSKLAYDHNEMTKVGIERLQSKIIYTDIARHLMPEEFTLSELQKVYEVVSGEEMDKRNFRKKMLALGILHDTKRTIKKGVMRPATLYRFKPSK